MKINTDTLVVLSTLLALHEAVAQQAVYPLHVGDRWQYSAHAWGPRSARILQDSVMPNGIRYSLLSFGVAYWEQWERAFGNQVLRYDPQTSQEHLWYDFTLSPGDTVNIIPSGTDSTIILFIGSGTRQLFGATRPWWAFHIYTALPPRDALNVEITDSLGVTYVSFLDGSSWIEGAIINGIQYGTITSIPNFIPTTLRGLRLDQNYPNPFNPATTITLEIPRAGIARLCLFDVLGREVALLMNEIVSAGVHRTQFDGAALPSGVYFYRLSANGLSATRKLIIQR